MYARTTGLSPGEAKSCRRAMLVGIGVGMVLSACLAYAMLAMSEVFDGDAFDLFQAAMTASAALLMLQTAFWVNGPSRPQLPSAGTIGSATIFAALCALAVAREGSETVVFVYGILAASSSSDSLGLGASIVGGLLTSVVVFTLLQLSGKAIGKRLFFKLSEALLLLFAGSLILNAADRLVGLDIVPILSPPLWDTSWLLDERGHFGSLLASLTGYRSRPELIVLVVLSVYWSTILLMLKRRNAAVAS